MQRPQVQEMAVRKILPRRTTEVERFRSRRQVPVPLVQHRPQQSEVVPFPRQTLDLDRVLAADLDQARGVGPEQGQERAPGLERERALGQGQDLGVVPTQAF